MRAIRVSAVLLLLVTVGAYKLLVTNGQKFEVYCSDDVGVYIASYSSDHEWSPEKEELVCEQGR